MAFSFLMKTELWSRWWQNQALLSLFWAYAPLIIGIRRKRKGACSSFVLEETAVAPTGPTDKEFPSVRWASLVIALYLQGETTHQAWGWSPESQTFLHSLLISLWSSFYNSPGPALFWPFLHLEVYKNGMSSQFLLGFHCLRHQGLGQDAHKLSSLTRGECPISLSCKNSLLSDSYPHSSQAYGRGITSNTSAISNAVPEKRK